MQAITYIGLGRMGQGMVSTLLKADYPVTIWNRTAERCAPLVEQGAVQAASPIEAARGADVIMYCLADDAAVEDLVWGQGGLVHAVSAGQIVIDCSTVNPDLSRCQARTYSSLGAHFLDAPVFGSKGQAAEGGLWMVVGGDQAVYEQALPLLDALTASTHYMGPNGQGTAMKLAGNLLVASMIEGLGEMLTFATKAGLDLEAVAGLLSAADWQGTLIDGIPAAMGSRDFEPYFALKHMLKDANLIAQYAEALNVPLPALAAIRENLKTAVNRGWGEDDAAAMIQLLEENAGVQIGQPVHIDRPLSGPCANGE